MRMIEIIANDRLGRKGEWITHERGKLSCLRLFFPLIVRVKCSPDDTVGILKKLIAAQTGTQPEKVSQSSTTCFKGARGRNSNADLLDPLYIVDSIEEVAPGFQGSHHLS